MPKKEILDKKKPSFSKTPDDLNIEGFAKRHIGLKKEDIQSITNEMKEEFMKNSSVYEHGENADLTSNYFTVLTEREASTLNKNKLVYRALLQSAHDHN